MSVGEAPKIGSDEYAWAGLSSATKPPSAFVGQKAIETDTGDTYEWTGASWQLIATNGSKVIVGASLSTAVADKADSGDTTAVVIAGTDKVRVYGVSISADATLTGDIIIKVGSTQKTVKMRNAIVGGTHWIMPLSDNYIEGAAGEDVIINNSVAEDISYAIYYTTV
ncbi:hypothetical protein KAR91_09925 [Candidatus Pacearchaeota archaeon]|nr:hypothetical protein [Candidatus Pacearchaeota archaeon]